MTDEELAKSIRESAAALAGHLGDATARNLSVLLQFEGFGFKEIQHASIRNAGMIHVGISKTIDL